MTYWRWCSTTCARFNRELQAGGSAGSPSRGLLERLRRLHVAGHRLVFRELQSDPETSPAPRHSGPGPCSRPSCLNLW